MKQVRDVPLGLIISCRNLSIFFLIINSLWFCIFWSFLFEECSVISSVCIFSSFQVKRRVVRKMWKEFNEDGDAEDGWPGCKLQISGIGSDRSSNSTTTSSQVSTHTLVHKALHILLQMLQIVIFSPKRFLTVTRAFKHFRRRNRFGKKCFR